MSFRLPPITRGFLVACTALVLPPALQTAARATVVTETLVSAALADTRTGLNPQRTIKVYLPPGYETSRRTYPVVYYLHTINWSAEQMFADGNLVHLLERGFDEGIIREFIFIAADYSSPTMGSWYENSSTTGRWLDFTTQELVPFIDGRFRTRVHRDSRGIAGDFLGGYGALKLAMLHPELFSSVYALHPVATGQGSRPMHRMVDWERVHRAQQFSELWGDYYAPGFVAMAQAYLPNPDRPPFYCDFIVEPQDGEMKLHVENLKKLKARFSLDELLREHGDNLRQMRGIAFDWGRYDRTDSHVYANQRFTRLLDEFGIDHLGEEYNGDIWDKTWTPDGRFITRVLPFFNRHLAFE